MSIRSDQQIGLQLGVLELEYHGAPLDMYAIAKIHFNLHWIIVRIEDALYALHGIKPNSTDRVRAEVALIRTGSLFEQVLLLVQQQDVRAILTNLLSNVIWVIALTVASDFRQTVEPQLSSTQEQPSETDSILRNNFMIAEDVNEIISAIRSNNKDSVAELHLRVSEDEHGKKLDLRLKMHPRDSHKKK